MCIIYCRLLRPSTFIILGIHKLTPNYNSHLFVKQCDVSLFQRRDLNHFQQNRNRNQCFIQCRWDKDYKNKGIA